MSTAAISWMSPMADIPQLTASDDPVENSKQVLKALKCVAFSSKQVGDVMRRRRERLTKRLQAVADETELLRAHIVENVLNQRQRLEQLRELQDDLEQAQTLGQPDLLKDLADELKLLRREDQRESVLLRNLKRTMRSRVRVKRALQEQKTAADEAMLVFNCKNSLIQTMVATCSKTTFLSASELGYEEEGYVEGEHADDEEYSGASESDYDLSDFAEVNEDIDMDVDFAAGEQSESDYPKLRVAQSDSEHDGEDEKETIAESSVSAWSFESDSQASSTVKNSRRRSVSFGPLPLTEENVKMAHPMTLEELSEDDAEGVGDRRKSM
ncbi:hypothetical protein F443_21544 [Phytophthora nicotianae P1569]|uniref:Uncharacterized protein n=3 Tax=Phytophthora nicotianae TaxID=4792 RepID=V9DXD2_PHYNI|nr:hypothetical protein F443_21544 [Phytophthora nicotianae P1569]ETO60203.1 hypothetical protein F444_21559 [Phytophthora nicotianae P1976]KUF99462.1 hypothetical protein AM588_10010911 [Phytophthora nicotianae]